jgi:tetratricopeptide (TPR) repeat protein
MVPTILDLVKAPLPDNLRGRSLKPLLEDTGPIRKQPIYAEALYAHYHFGWSPLTGLTEGPYRYISAPREELYDVTRDPKQRTNLADPDRLGSALPPELTSARETRKTFSRELERLAGDISVDKTAAGETAVAADPKDKVAVLEVYRDAQELVAARKYAEAVGLLQRVLRDVPQATEVWNNLADVALMLNRNDLALDAYRHIIELEPTAPDGYLGAADVLLKERRLEDARARAAEAVEVLADGDSRSRADAHELLARIALARRNADEAREEAALAEQANPGLPMSAFVEARLLYDQGRFEDAMPVFEKAVAAAAKPGASSIFELHYYAGDTLLRLNRPAEAEAEFRSALVKFPQNVRARAALATLYHTTGQPEAASDAIAEMLRIVPTPESYAAAVRLWTSFGKPREAQAVRAEAKRYQEVKAKK